VRSSLSPEGRSAFELFEELKPDALVLCGDLPNGDSLELTTFLKECLLAVRILFVPATMLGPLGVTS
jgi:DNA-binding response OmpR family regulator